MSKTVFLSSVSSEFGKLRERIAKQAERMKKCHIRHQDDFFNRGVTTLQKLDEEIQQSDFVVHLIGAEAGWCVPKDQAEMFLQQNPGFGNRFPGLVDQACQGGLPATQWEAWLGLYYGKRLVAFQLQVETMDPLQSRHLMRLKIREVHPDRAANEEVLYDEVMGSLDSILATTDENTEAPESGNAQRLDGGGAEQPQKRKPAPEPPQALIDLISNGRIVPVIGSGISASAHSDDALSLRMPTYRELIEQLAARAISLGFSDRGVDRVMALLEDGKPDEAARLLYQDILRNSFFLEFRRILNPYYNKLKPSLSHTLLRVLNFDLVITTNYDRLLERFVTLNHEVITPLDVDALEHFVNELDSENDKLLIKLHGDISRPESILFGRDNKAQFYQITGIRDNEDDAIVMAAEEIASRNNRRRFAALSTLFQGRSFLFLGLSFLRESEGYVNTLEKYLKKSIHPHYALIARSEAEEARNLELSKEINIVFIEYEPDEYHSQVPEFISYLNAGKKDKPEIGNKWAQWYLPRERCEYLKRQLEFETDARAVRFLTPTLTNGIATDAHLYEKCAPNHEGEEGVLDCMVDRRNNLLEGLHSGRLQVEILFLQEALDKDFDEPDIITIERYNSLLQLIENTALDIEVRLLPDLSQKDLNDNQATHALIYMARPAPDVDAVVAYARQATVTNAVSVSMVEVNTEAVKIRSYQFDRYWASAWSEQKTARYIKSKLEAVNAN